MVEITEQDGKKLAAVVRESVVLCCLGPESRKVNREALKALVVSLEHQSLTPPDTIHEATEESRGLELLLSTGVYWPALTVTTGA